MKKSHTIVNIIIVLMISTLTILTVNNTKTLKVQADTRVVYSGNSEENNVCFMINVYQGEEYVKNILDIMDIYNVKTTFFIGGSWAVKNIELIKEIYTRGHEIGNHGF